MEEKKNKSGRGVIYGLMFGLLLGVITGNLALWLAPGLALGWTIELLLKKQIEGREDSDS